MIISMFEPHLPAIDYSMLWSVHCSCSMQELEDILEDEPEMAAMYLTRRAQQEEQVAAISVKFASASDFPHPGGRTAQKTEAPDSQHAAKRASAGTDRQPQSSDDVDVDAHTENGEVPVADIISPHTLLA